MAPKSSGEPVTAPDGSAAEQGRVEQGRTAEENTETSYLGEPSADIEAIVDVLRQLADGSRARLDLQRTLLSNTDFHEANLRRAKLRGTDLRGASLHSADLQRANLMEAQLQKTNFTNAKLQGADLVDANLQGAYLIGAEFQKPDEADDFRGADLRDADLRGAFLTGANLEGAHLMRTKLQGVNLEEAEGLTQDQLNKAIGDENTKLPKSAELTPPESWSIREFHDNNNQGAHEAYVQWLRQHPHGFVLNLKTAKQGVLHESDCMHIADYSDPDVSLTDNRKVCGPARVPLEAWAAECEIELKRCRTCFGWFTAAHLPGREPTGLRSSIHLAALQLIQPPRSSSACSSVALASTLVLVAAYQAGFSSVA